MNLKISAPHLEVTPALRACILSKLDRVTRHFDSVVTVGVTLRFNKHKDKEHQNTVEVNLHTKGADIHVEHTNGDMYATIDLAIDKLDRRVTEHKERVKYHRPGMCPKRTAGNFAAART